MGARAYERVWWVFLQASCRKLWGPGPISKSGEHGNENLGYGPYDCLRAKKLSSRPRFSTRLFFLWLMMCSQLVAFNMGKSCTCLFWSLWRSVFIYLTRKAAVLMSRPTGGNQCVRCFLTSCAREFGLLIYTASSEWRAWATSLVIGPDTLYSWERGHYFYNLWSGVTWLESERVFNFHFHARFWLSS